jgi:hypothetical protein
LAIFHEVIALDLIVVVNCILVVVFGPLSARDLRTNTIPGAPSTAHRIRDVSVSGRRSRF